MHGYAAGAGQETGAREQHKCTPAISCNAPSKFYFKTNFSHRNSTNAPFNSIEDIAAKFLSAVNLFARIRGRGGTGTAVLNSERSTVLSSSKWVGEPDYVLSYYLAHTKC